MKKNKISIFVILLIIAILFTTFVSATVLHLDLGTSGDFVILAKSGISTTGTTVVTGDIGVSPIDSTAITGFNLIGVVTTDSFLTSSLVEGKIYSSNLVSPTPTKMTTAVSDMETAYTTANGLAPDVTELGAGNIGGLTLTPGVYKWNTDLTIPTDVILDAQGNSDAVWIFQVVQNLDVSSSTKVILIGDAKAENIFWIVGGQATLGTTSVFNGNILSQTAIVLNTGAQLNGRALAQTAVTLDANSIFLSQENILPENVTNNTTTNNTTTNTTENVTNNTVTNNTATNMTENVTDETETCFCFLKDVPAVCVGGIITQNTDLVTYDNCRHITCENEDNLLKIIACEKPDEINPEYFEMYKQPNSVGSGIQICLGDACIGDNNGFDSQNFPVCTNTISQNITAPPESLLLNMTFNSNVSSSTPKAVIDYSTFENHGTLGDGIISPVWVNDGKVGGAYLFDGVDDVINLGSDSIIDNMNKFTACAWVKPSSTTYENDFGIFLNKNTDGFHGWNFFTRSAGGFGFSYWNGLSTGIWKDSLYQVDQDVWNYLCFSYNNSGSQGINLYANGIITDVYTVQDNSGFVQNDSNGELHIGSVSGKYTFNGAIDEVKIYNYVLSPEQIYQEYLDNGGDSDIDTTSPIITLLGNNPINITLGDNYVDAGATANDDIDGNITSNIVVVNPVNVNLLGTYTITYNVQDSTGNEGVQVTRTVNVITPSVILPLPPNLGTSSSRNSKSDETKSCISTWECTGWSTCNSLGIQTRICTVKKSCNPNNNNPITSKECNYFTPFVISTNESNQINIDTSSSDNIEKINRNLITGQIINQDINKPSWLQKFFEWFSGFFKKIKIQS